MSSPSSMKENKCLGYGGEESVLVFEKEEAFG